MRINLVVEGASEAAFVDELLKPHLGLRGIHVAARLVETSRRQGRVHRGGGRHYRHLRDDLRRWMAEQRAGDVCFSTMIDLYGLPADFPGRDRAASGSDAYERVSALEAALTDDIGDPRFVPYIQLHEFEALLLADPRQFDWQFVDHEAGIKVLTALSDSVPSPELIDDGPDSAPSKRIIASIPDYRRSKPSASAGDRGQNRDRDDARALPALRRLACASRSARDAHRRLTPPRVRRRARPGLGRGLGAGAR